MHRGIAVAPKCIKHILILILLLLTFSLLWAEQKYGNIGFDEIVFHLKMPLKGVAPDYIRTYTLKAIIPTCVFLL